MKNNFLLLILLFSSSCAYVRHRTIDVPADIAERAQIEVIPETQQKDEKELIVKLNLLKDKLIRFKDKQDIESIMPLTQDIALSFVFPGKFPVIPRDSAKDSVKDEVKDLPAVEEPVKKVKTVKKVHAAKAAPLVSAATPNRNHQSRIIVNPFRVGEKIKLRIEYLSLTAAYLTIETMPFVLINGRKSFHFRGTMETSTLMNILYRAHDTLDEYIDYQDFVPVKEEVHLNETKQNMEQIVIYDHNLKKSMFWKKKIDNMDRVTEVRRIDDFVENALDVPAMVYFARTQDLKVGSKIETIVYDNGKLWELTVEVLRTELINTCIGKVDTLLLKPTLRLNGEIQQKGELLLWITNDDRKIPVKFKAKAKIGSVEGEIAELIRN